MSGSTSSPPPAGLDETIVVLHRIPLRFCHVIRLCGGAGLYAARADARIEDHGGRW
jgi:hypothetical protein